MQARIDVDVRWPRSTVRVYGAPSPAMYEEAMLRYERLVLARDVPYVNLIDAREGEVPGPVERKVINDWMRRFAAREQRLSRGEVILVRGLAALIVVRIIYHWGEKPPYPVLITEDPEAAEAFLTERARPLTQQRPAGAHA